MSIKKVNLALQGGGAHGAFAWGVIDRILEEERIEIGDISATSAGSINAIIYAYGNIKGGREAAKEELYKFWYKISQAGQLFTIPTPLDSIFKKWSYNLFDSVNHIVSPYQFNPLNINYLRDIIEEMVDFAEVKTNKINDLFISATNVSSGNVRIFKTEELSIDVILASACLPYLFHAVQIEGNYYWDGGYMANPAISPLFNNKKSKDVILVHINPIVRNKLPTEASEIMNRINEITFNSSLIKELKTIAFMTKIIEEGWLKEEHHHKLQNILVHSIRADQALEDLDVSSKFNTNWNFLQNLRDLGRQEAEKWLAENFASIGDKSTINLNDIMLEEYMVGDNLRVN